MNVEVLGGSILVSDIIDGRRIKRRYMDYSASEAVIRFAQEYYDFEVHGTYTLSNSMGYLVQLSDCGTMARALCASDKPELTEWSEIEHRPCEEDDIDSVFDADGYEIDLGLVMRSYGNTQ